MVIRFNQMVSQKAPTVIGLLIMLSLATSMSAAIECSTVASLVSTCLTFITYGSPDPFPGSPCCDAVASLKSLGDRTSLCRCVMDLISTSIPNATAIATLPGFCGISLGFTVEPNTDCSRTV